MQRSNVVARPTYLAFFTIIAAVAMFAMAALPAAASHGPVHPQVSIEDVSANEGGNLGQTSFNFDVCVRDERDQLHTGFTVNYITSALAPSSTTASPSSDYTHTSGELEFLPGGDCEAVSVSVSADRNDEWDEVFRVVLFDAQDATIGDGIALGTIVNDDNPAVRAVNASTNEGDEPGEKMARFEIQLRSGASGGATTPVPSNEAITVNYTTRSGTPPSDPTGPAAATEGSDFDDATGSVSFPLGPDGFTATEMFVDVPIIGEHADEQNENFFFDVTFAGQPTNTAGNRPTATGTIVNDDPKLFVSDEVVLEGDGTGTVNVTFEVVLTAATRSQQTEPVSVQYTTNDRTAEATDPLALPPAEGDYESASGLLQFPDTDATPLIHEVTVTINSDNADEFDETFVLELSNAQNTFIGDGVGETTIQDDDIQLPSAPRLSVVQTSAPEGDPGSDGTAMVTIQADKTVPTDVTFDWDTGGGSAQNDDFEQQPTTEATIPGGQDHVTVEVPFFGDNEDEQDEFFFIFLSNASSNAQIADPTGRVTLTNDDDPVARISNAQVLEGDEDDEFNLVFTVNLDQPPKFGDATFQYTTEGTTAEPEDFTATSGTLTFQDNEETDEKTIEVPVSADDVDENIERLRLILSNPTNATIQDGLGNGAIRDNDAAPAVSVANVEIEEGNEGRTHLTFSLTLSEPSERTSSVAFATAELGAKAPQDFVAKSGRQGFKPGQTIKSVIVRIEGDTLEENDERLRLVLSNPRKLQVFDDSAFGKILDDDGA